MIEIRTPEQFCLIGNDPDYPLDGIYSIMNDLDFDGIAFQPIGSFSNFFCGSIYGNKRILSNITIYSPFTDTKGIFAYIARNGDTPTLIQDLGLENIAVTGKGRVGGLAAVAIYGTFKNIYIKDSTITRIIAEGSNSAYYDTGGLFSNITGGMLFNCYSTAEISLPAGAVGTQQTGRLVGRSTFGVFHNSYYLQEVGQPDNNLGTPKTEVEMKQQETFVGWDFEKTWGIDEGVDYPYLEMKADLFRQDLKVFSQEITEYGYNL